MYHQVAYHPEEADKENPRKPNLAKGGRKIDNTHFKIHEAMFTYDVCMCVCKYAERGSTGSRFYLQGKQYML